MLKRVAITGPESTGKTRLAQALSLHFNTKHVPEYAREYLGQAKGKYTIKDILKIAKGQLELEKEVSAGLSGLLFCDTDLTVLKVWSQVVFNSCPQWIREQFVQHTYDLYLLCYPDLEWEADPLRENPTDRMFLFELYRQELEEAGFNYQVIKGRGDRRLENAINFVSPLTLDL